MKDKPSGRLTQNRTVPALRVVWRHRALLITLVQRDIRNRYQGSLMGALWALLHPLALLGMYTIVFEVIFKVKIPQLELGQPYVMFVGVVLWPWLMFQEAVSRGIVAVTQNTTLVKKVAFQHELLIYSAVISSFIVHSLGYCFVLSVMILGGMSPHLMGLLGVLLYLPLLLLLATAFALMLGALQVFVRDVEHAMQQILAVLFYATPILYPLSQVPGWMREVMNVNPVAVLTEPIRGAWLQGQAPDAMLWLMAFTACSTFAWAGRWIFRRLSPFFEDAV
jgi:lipopolysaccharide transport system permease protein